MNLLIVGAGGHGRCCYEIAERMFVFKQIDFVDDNAKEVFGKQVVGKVLDLSVLKSKYDAVCIAIGNNQVRKELMNKAKTLGYKLPCLIDPQATISASCVFEEGTVIFPQAVLESCCHVGKGCIISTNAVIDHDAIIHDYCHINASAIVPSMMEVPNYTKVEYGQVYRKNDDERWKEEYKKQFGKEPSYF